jgi:hypothetical protein
MDLANWPAITLPESTDAVRFRVRDVCVPPASELLVALWGNEVLEGRIIARSPAAVGAHGEQVVIKVPGLEQMLVVSTEHLLGKG